MKRFTPVKAIRTYCIDCQNGALAEVRRCPVETCSIWRYRMGRRPSKSTHLTTAMDQAEVALRKVTPVKAIRARCVDCNAHQLAEVRRCRKDDCPLWPFRMGRRPTTPIKTIESEPTPASVSISQKNMTLRGGFTQGELF